MEMLSMDGEDFVLKMHLRYYLNEQKNSFAEKYQFTHKEMKGGKRGALMTLKAEFTDKEKINKIHKIIERTFQCNVCRWGQKAKHFYNKTDDLLPLCRRCDERQRKLQCKIFELENSKDKFFMNLIDNNIELIKCRIMIRKINNKLKSISYDAS